MSLPSAPKDYDQRDQQALRSALDQMDNQNRKVVQDIVLGPAEHLVFYDVNGAMQSVLGSVVGGWVRSDTASQGLTPTQQANARTNIGAGSGAGSVSSVGLALPSFITVSGSPVTSSGTLTGTLATQTANTIFAGPTTGAATPPTFRAMVTADIPNSIVTLAKIANAAANSRVVGSGSTGSSSAYTELTTTQVLDAISTTQGAVLYRGASSWSALAPGTAGNVLQTNGAGADPSWGAASGVGGMVLLATATPSGTGVVTFNPISGSYTHLKVMGVGRSTVAGTGTAFIKLTFNNDTAANYAQQRMFGNGSGSASKDNVTGASWIQPAEVPTAGDIANYGSAFEVTILNYTNTTFTKNASSHYGVITNTTTGSLFDITVSGTWSGTAAITRLDLTLSSGNWVAGSDIRLYGIP